ncbi:hypothetical protein MMC20_000359 [Loxospora ochrophaea]|nr:hypothetical protein [Loxospora ochrophaea]
MCSSDIFLGLLAILFPPIAVWIKRGLCSADSLINIALCMLGYVPGLLHAWYIIAKFPDGDYDEYEVVPSSEQRSGGTGTGANGNGNVTYYYVGQAEQGGQQQQQQQQQQRGYGTNEGGMRVGQSGSGAGNASGGQEQAQGGVPPSYEQAVAGDHKVQT